MKILSFRIRNFRSLIDSGWKNFANDNITVMIGQNESGKTSVLESLNSFYTGDINEDVLRSDLSMPVVSCKFELQGENVLKIIRKEKLPPEIQDTIKNLHTFKLTRIWDDLITSRVILDEESINEYFQANKRTKEKELELTQSKLQNTAVDFEKTQNHYRELLTQKNEEENTLNELENTLTQKEKALNKTKRESKSQQLTEEIKQLKNQIKETKSVYENTKKEFGEVSNQLNLEDLIFNISQKVQEIHNEYSELSDRAENIYDELREAESTLGILASEKERRATLTKLESTKKSYIETTQKLNEKGKDYEYWLIVADKVIQGESQANAEKSAKAFQEKEERYYTPEELGAIFFDQIPQFEFFQDFSSLLPDKIDLEDIILKHDQVKGYKAVRNYLKIANLKPEFFDQKNSRILKQKIEKLNNEITIDFHEYWRQSVGKDNKINISFELEHYDHNTPDKIGKPYIEFWIKDKDERLYPKQRSRGVRWFLSFYLELKAYAKGNNKNRILLIDEPAMSLHARAQEDVLTVFEDIKENLQIVYTTHSPHLINENKLYRVLAIQRASDSDYSESVIYEPGALKTASSDTLTPIYVLMGSRINAQEFIHKDNNIILEDLPTYFYFMALSKITDLSEKLHFIPSTDTSNVPNMANLLLGWKLGFIIVLGNTEASKNITEYFKQNLFQNNEKLTRKNILHIPEGIRKIEDVFSTLDFKKYVLNQRVGITESNSDYIDHNKLSRSILASSFLSKVQNEQLALDDFDEETRENIKDLVNGLLDLLRSETVSQTFL